MFDNQLALRDYDEAIRLDPHDDVLYQNRGTQLWIMGRLEEAERDFQQMVGKWHSPCHRLHGQWMTCSIGGTDAWCRFEPRLRFGGTRCVGKGPGRAARVTFHQSFGYASCQLYYEGIHVT